MNNHWKHRAELSQELEGSAVCQLPKSFVFRFLHNGVKEDVKVARHCGNDTEPDPMSVLDDSIEQSKSRRRFRFDPTGATIAFSLPITTFAAETFFAATIRITHNNEKP